jgi:hypothetical protein
MDTKLDNLKAVFSYDLDYDVEGSQKGGGLSYRLKKFTSCIIDYSSNQVVDKLHLDLTRDDSLDVESIYNAVCGFYKKYEEKYIFTKKPFVPHKEFNSILLKVFVEKELIKDEESFIFSYDCFDILDIYKMYSFCKTGKVEEKDLKSMLTDFGIVPQEEEGGPFFKTVNCSRLSVQMMKKIGLIFLMSDMGGAKL